MPRKLKFVVVVLSHVHTQPCPYMIEQLNLEILKPISFRTTSLTMDIKQQWVMITSCLQIRMKNLAILNLINDPNHVLD